VIFSDIRRMIPLLGWTATVHILECANNYDLLELVTYDHGSIDDQGSEKKNDYLLT
jgi:hypothetical protein